MGDLACKALKDLRVIEAISQANLVVARSISLLDRENIIAAVTESSQLKKK